MPQRKRTPKHARVGAEIRRLIRTGQFAVGEAIPTEAALCEQFECSRGTVRRALDTLVNEGLVRRKQGSGHFVARQSVNARESLFGLIVPNILNAEVLRLAQLFSLEANKRGYRLVLCVSSEQPPVEREFVRELHRLKASGIIKFPTMPEVPDFEPQIRARMRGFDVPYVIVNDFWTDTRRDHHVAFDENAAIEMAVDHLVGLGHTRIGWVDGSDGPRYHALRFLTASLAKRALDLTPDRILMCHPYETPPVERLWTGTHEGPTALITPYDGMAVRLIEALPRIDLRVPEDVSVVNLNGQPFYGTAGLEFTTAAPPNDEIVIKVLEILADGGHDEAICRYLFPPSFHVGRTTAGPRDARTGPSAGELVGSQTGPTGAG